MASILIILASVSTLLLLAHQAWSTSHEDPTAEAAMRLRFEEFVSKYRREYKDEKEKEMRYQIFKREATLVDASNAAGEPMAINNFSDKTLEEFNSMFGHPSFYDCLQEYLIDDYFSGDVNKARVLLLEICVVFPMVLTVFLIGACSRKSELRSS
ncbi:Fruit bromelain [Linum grandiflorum]